ncbi:MAG TPA: hypothetical protein VEY10_09300 [Flavisolibacter sp.]|nr:hypothetical protein [Flavisolibacter sp.]
MVPPETKYVDSYSRLYDKYAPALYGVILKLTPDVQLATNILERSFIKIWEALPVYEAAHGGNFSMMLRITLHECKNTIGLSQNSVNHLFLKQQGFH